MAAIRSPEASQEVTFLRSRPTHRPLHQRLVAATAITAILLGALAFTGTSRADIVYGDFSGTTVDYINVKEDDKGFFGSPIISGDTLAFNPVGFEAESNDGGITAADGTLAFTIDAKPGNVIDAFEVSESGFYTLLSFQLGAGTDLTRVVAIVGITINVLEVDNTPLGGGEQFSQNVTFADYNLLDDGTAILQPWSGDYTFDVSAALAGANIDGAATLVNVTIDNTLYAISEDGTYSYIDKKAFNAFAVTVVPEPGTLALAMLGGTMMFYGRFRRHRAA